MWQPFSVTPGQIIGYTKRGRPIRVIAGGALNVDGLPTDPEQFQAYLSALDDQQIPRLEAGLVEAFDKLHESPDDLGDDGVKKLSLLADQIKATRAEFADRRDTAIKQAAEQTAEAHRQALANLHASVHSSGGSGDSGSGDEGDGDDPDVKKDDESVVEVVAASFASAFEKFLSNQVQRTLVAAGNVPDLNAHIRNIPLSTISQHAPTPRVPEKRQEAVLVASTDIPGRAHNARIGGMAELVELMGSRARMLPVTRGNPNYVPVASLQRDHRYRLGLDSTPEEINEVLIAAADVETLVAAGGWCAPSEISYDFFNIVCEDGLVDLPSVGVLNRGGLRFPTSPSIADIFATVGALWSWTETQDIAAATGTGQSGTKTCARVPCPGFSEVRTACDGLCVTVGNLVDYAYPELVANHIALVMAARAHRTNQQVLAGLATGSTAVTYAGPTGEAAAASILNGVEHQAIDYRERYRMCEDAVIEVIFPRWALAIVRADIANRSGMTAFDVTSGQIADWFNVRSIRAQFVADWQSGFTGNPFGAPTVNATTWPSTVQFLLYAPGTWVRGQGLQLDLGVVRDSTLNATNDHTAAWMEDCFAVARVGHESRVVTTPTVPDGAAGNTVS